MKCSNNNLSLILITILSVSCSQPQVVSEPKTAPQTKPVLKHHKETVTSTPAPPPKKIITVRDKLISHYNDWKGVRYKFGGNTKSGIDCSGFVQQTYQQLFFKNLPRTTLSQSSIGNKIPRKQLREGDLVFFKRGRSFRHVGIYLDKGRFLHVSSKKGVTISNLDNEYWKKYFWKAKRILP